MRSCDAAVGRRLTPRRTPLRTIRGTTRAIPWVLLATLQLLVAAGTAHAQREDYERPPIDYLNAEVNDPVAQLARRIERGETKL